MENPRQKVRFLLDALPDRMRKEGMTLTPHFVGGILLKFSDTQEQYRCEWGPDAMTVTRSESRREGEEHEGVKSELECVLETKTLHLLRIAQGDLNPQLAMLSGKIKVSGKIEPAVYFFNLVAPIN
jgi:SCP-2 sterol transfer family